MVAPANFASPTQSTQQSPQTAGAYATAAGASAATVAPYQWNGLNVFSSKDPMTQTALATVGAQVNPNMPAQQLTSGQQTGAGTQVTNNSPSDTASFHPYTGPDNSFVPPLHTQGSQIIDATGKVVKLVSTALGGFGGGAPFGVWSKGNSIPHMLDMIKASGFNSIRLPISMDALTAPNGNSVENNGNLAVNHPELVGAKPINVLDYFLDQAAQRGIGVVLDMHGFGTSDYMPSQPYNTQNPNDPTGDVINGLNDPTNVVNGGKYNIQDYAKVWSLLAQRYAGHPSVIGADLLNEPHGGKITWGTGNPNTDWNTQAEYIGKQIQQYAPNWLMVVEGIDADIGKPGGTTGDAWWGGNLTHVASNPVQLNNIVYSPHEYGSSVYGQGWLNDPTALQTLWDRSWGYIAKQGIAPVWIGEFGTRSFDPNSTDGKWIRQLLDYTNANGISWSYWIWHDASSGDTGGLAGSYDGQPEIPFSSKISVLQNYMLPPSADPVFGSGQNDYRSGYRPQLNPNDSYLSTPGFPPPVGQIPANLPAASQVPTPNNPNGVTPGQTAPGFQPVTLNPARPPQPSFGQPTQPTFAPQPAQPAFPNFASPSPTVAPPINPTPPTNETTAGNFASAGQPVSGLTTAANGVQLPINFTGTGQPPAASPLQNVMTSSNNNIANKLLAGG